ncbi:hypothetical protein EB796_021949 [Bugula neritina]|uniref:Uncharacterized protein n=1 Tax=Bugula neritina TaxID=10212 RepID=A0A7J7J211_BUGNE|nr:hypothetical protein EB796_021949 [Bugula neritina]
MDNNLRFRSQFGNDDYAQLDRWSTCKTSPNDSHSLIYTSDYGSYSSQESNHSGTTYSNLADCEEALHSSPTISYDIPPSQLYGRMETRRDKPLPPPRMTSKPQSKSPRFQEMGKPKKISFDDSSMTKSKTKDNEEAIPSFATLPRKKKLRNNTKVNTPSTPTTSQVTWMKDVAQKAETIHYPTVTTPGNGFKKPQGILKNKSEEPKKSGDLTGYIQRDKVQKILAKQRQALSRPSNISSPPYRSMPSLTPRQQGEPQQAAKAWEYNHADGSSSSTAQVIGVIEPSSDGSPQQFFHHVKQNSNETEFEFPPPPTDHDIEQIMSSPDAANGASIAKKKDFTPLQLACSKQPPTHNISSKPALLSSRGKTDTVGANSKPPVPLRMDKLHTHSNYSRDSRPVNHSQKPESENSMKTPIPKAIVPQEGL